MRQNTCAPFFERKQPDIFCLSFTILKSRSAKEWFQNNFPQKRATCLEKRTGSEVQCKTKVLGNS
jgi:hypothetical protein